MRKRKEVSADPRINEWGPEVFIWWPYIVMVACFIAGLLIGLVI